MRTSRLLAALALPILAAPGRSHAAGAAFPPPASVFPSSSWWLEPVVLLCVVQTLLIAILFRQWRRRRRAERMLTERLAFEELLSDLHAQFVGAETTDVDRRLRDALGRVAESLDADRGGFVDYRDLRDGMVHPIRWARRPEIMLSGPYGLAEYPWLNGRLMMGELVRFARVEDLPPEASVDRESFTRLSTVSHINVPFLINGTVVGGMFFGTVGRSREWPDDLVRRLHLLAEVFVYALARKRSDDEIRESREIGAAIMDSLPHEVIVIDRAGTIIAANGRAGRRGRPSGGEAQIVGGHYLDLWHGERAGALAGLEEVESGVAGVLRGALGNFETEMQRTEGPITRWFELRVRPLLRASGGAVLARIEITARKRAEADVRRMREALARAGRMTTLGQLTAASAPEVNQPLTGILTNAQAARRFLESPSPDLDEVRAILDDIVEDDRRAGRVLERLRSMLRRREPEVTEVDVNQLVLNVVHFLHSDAVIRNAAVNQELDPTLPTVGGDVVQLQQVLINLVLNGLEAMQAVVPERRRLLIKTQRMRESLLVAVTDTGTGLGDGPLDHLFEPFPRTKAAGMGMGLPIAMSIVEAHGGHLWAADNPEGGATFFFTLPLAPVPAAVGPERARSAPLPI